MLSDLSLQKEQPSSFAFKTHFFQVLENVCVEIFIYMNLSIEQWMSIVRIANSLFKQIPVLSQKCCLHFYILVHQIW